MPKKKKQDKVKIKKHPGTSFRAKPRPKLVGDSYQADEKDLKKLRRLARKHSISKAEILRYATKLALMVYAAREQGQTKLTIKFDA